MQFNELKTAILKIDGSREYMVCEAGIKGLFFLFEKGVPGLHVIDGTPDEVLAFVRAGTPEAQVKAATAATSKERTINVSAHDRSGSTGVTQHKRTIRSSLKEQHRKAAEQLLRQRNAT